jgi:hypothetical protein
MISRMDRLERKLNRPETMTTSQPIAKAPEPAPSREATEEPVGPDPVNPAPTPEPAGPAIDISFDKLQKIWPGLFGGLRDVLGARRWALFREAVPAAVEGNTIVLEVADDFHLNSLAQDDAVSAVVATKASDLLGAPVRVRFQRRDAVEEDDGKVDLSQLEERPDADADPATLLAAELGAKLVDE